MLCGKSSLGVNTFELLNLLSNYRDVKRQAEGALESNSCCESVCVCVLSAVFLMQAALSGGLLLPDMTSGGIWAPDGTRTELCLRQSLFYQRCCLTATSLFLFHLLPRSLAPSLSLFCLLTRSLVFLLLCFTARTFCRPFHSLFHFYTVVSFKDTET